MNRELFFQLPDGRQAMLYTLSNGRISARISDWGGTVINLLVPDRDGKMRDVVLGHHRPEDYFANQNYFGALVGRYANRIRNGKFRLEGQEFRLPVNEPARGCSLHGGEGYSNRLWEAEMPDASRLKLKLFSPDGDAGYPGNLTLEVQYSLTGDNALKIEYRAQSDRTTVVNFTNHSYFNLNGCDGDAIGNHELMLESAFYTETDRNLLPSGWLCRVNGTPYDLRTPVRLAEVFEALPGGYDTNFVLEEHCADLSRPAVTAFSPDSGIKLESYTTEPGMQIYTAGALDAETTLKGGRKGAPYLGFCLEAQHFPDSPNHPEFPSTELKAGEIYQQTTLYRFSVC